jgi:bifunctional non-homologous end joining protein LigD
VGQFSFLEWTPDDHLRHPSFVGLRDDKDARSVVRES